MKIKQGYKLVSVAGEHTVVPVEIQNVDFHVMITLNSTGAFLWQVLQKECTEEYLISKMMEHYDVEEERAKRDTENFIRILEERGLLE